MKKIILVGGSTANLYAAKEFTNLNFNCVVYERSGSLQNDSVRRIPLELLNKLGFTTSKNVDNRYIKLTELKNKLSKGIDIRFNSEVKLNEDETKIIIDGKEIYFDYAIIITGHKKKESKCPNIYIYN